MLFQHSSRLDSVLPINFSAAFSYDIIGKLQRKTPRVLCWRRHALIAVNMTLLPPPHSSPCFLQFLLSNSLYTLLLFLSSSISLHIIQNFFLNLSPILHGSLSLSLFYYLYCYHSFSFSLCFNTYNLLYYPSLSLFLLT